MPNVDTGLGWSAKQEWLVSGTGELCYIRTFGGDDFPGQPLPIVASAADCAMSGFVVATFTASGASHTIKAGNPNPDSDVVTFIADDPEIIYFVSPTASSVIVVDITDSTGTYTDITINITATDGATGYRYAGWQGYFSWWNPVRHAPFFQTAREGLDSIHVINISFYKINSGYAVACIAKWYTPAGTVLVSPVLISSDTSAIFIGNTPTTPDPDLVSYSFLHDGMRFYMSIIGGNSREISGSLEYADLSQFAAALPEKVFSLIAADSYANILVIDSPDPYGDTSGEDGGEQTDPEDDPVDEETLPIPAVVGLGFSTIYVPTQTDLYNLAAYLWGGNLDLDNFLKLFANPMDSILGLSAVPLVLSGTYEPIYLGGQLLQGITMPRYTGRTAVKVDMGTATITERWGAYLDYDPYTELAVYVPFVGIKNIKADDVMGKTIRLMYDIDILSGACIAYIRPEGGSPLYEWSGQCAMQIPITGANWDNIFSTAINTVATLGGALFAPASAPVLGGAVASAASQAIAAKPRIERSGAVNGITGFLGQLRPYIIRTIPEAYIPNDQNKFIGYPSYVSVNLGSLTGYNEIASIHLENIPATGDELAELESILKGGVIF